MYSEKVPSGKEHVRICFHLKADFIVNGMKSQFYWTLKQILSWPLIAVTHEYNTAAYLTLDCNDAIDSRSPKPTMIFIL